MSEQTSCYLISSDLMNDLILDLDVCMDVMGVLLNNGPVLPNRKGTASDTALSLILLTEEQLKRTYQKVLGAEVISNYPLAGQKEGKP